jgi:hypothetical protein
MSKHPYGTTRLEPVDGHDQAALSEGLDHVLTHAERAAADPHGETERATALPATRRRSRDAGERLREETEARLDADRTEITQIRRDLAAVHSQLDQINSGIVALQTHSLRQTGGVALALSVLIAIAWRVIAG